MSPSNPLLHEIEQVWREAECLLTRDQVEAALQRLAAAITERLSGTDPLLLTVVNGAVIPAGILYSYLPFACEIDYIHASRYRGATEGGSTLHWIATPTTPLQGRTVLIVDDILDQGETLVGLIDYCRQQGAAAIYSAVMARKILPDGEQKGCADFVGFEVPNRYLFGFGLDYKGYWRNAPGIYAVADR